MGIFAGAGGNAAIETELIENQELIHLEASVEPDGSAMTLAIHTMEGQIDLAVPLARMPAAVAEIREAGSLMMRRQLRSGDNGKSTIKDLMRSAARPTSVMPTIDHATGDCVVIYFFEDRLPFVARLSREQVVEARASFLLEMKKLFH